MTNIQTQIHNLIKESKQGITLVKLRDHTIAAIETTGDQNIISSEYTFDLILSPDGAVIIMSVFLHRVENSEKFTIEFNPSTSHSIGVLREIGTQNGFRLWIFNDANLIGSPYFCDNLARDIIENMIVNALLHNANRKIDFVASHIFSAKDKQC